MSDDVVRLDDDGNVECPGCGEAYGLHQRVTVTILRDEEDGDATATICGADAKPDGFCGGGGTTVKRMSSKDIDGRRDSVLIGFECEHCDEVPCALRIGQHKGLTMMTWVAVDELTAIAGAAWRWTR